MTLPSVPVHPFPGTEQKLRRREPSEEEIVARRAELLAELMAQADSGPAGQVGCTV